MNENIYKPDIQNGAKMYQEIDKVGGRNLDYTKPIINSYSWQNFTDLVAYERIKGYKPKYSAMLAVCLMKDNLFHTNFFHDSKTYETKEDAFIIFLNENYMKIASQIPKWNYETGVYFDTFYKNWVHDTLRSTLKETNIAKDSISIDLSENENDESATIKDNIENKMINSSYAHRHLNIKDYDSPEDIFINKEKEYISHLLFKELEEKNNFYIDKKFAQVFAFISKFANGAILSNPEFAEEISGVMSKVITKANSKKNINLNVNIDIDITNEDYDDYD